MGTHAILSPSGASRWLACTPSARLEQQFPDRASSAADEGTLAHALCELYLRNHLGLINRVPFQSELKKIKANSWYNKEMDGHAMDYVDFVSAKIVEHKDPTVFIEEKINLQDYVPEGFGTADFGVIGDYLLEMVDFKYGKGVEVSAERNSQMMLYALGALKRYGLLYEIQNVRMTIYQPRIKNFSSWEISATELLAWGEEIVKPKAKLAFSGGGEYKAGDHCKFCRAKFSCKALADHNTSVAKYEFADPNKLSDEDIAKILEKAADIKTWLTNLQDYALAEAVNNGKKWPGFKLVAGRSVRQYANAEAIEKALKKAKIKPELFLTAPSLVTIGVLEKNIGKDAVDKLAGPFIIKPAGKPTLVPVWDKRPAINSADSAKIAFEDVNIDDDV